MAEISRWTNLTTESTETAKILLVMSRSGYQRSSIYSRACYSGQYRDYSSICSSYVQQQINSTIDISAPCPFAPGACDGPALTIDTGMIDSNYHLGVNTHKRDRISIRKTTTCAPLLGERYTDGWLPFPLNLTTKQTQNSSFKGYAFGQLTWPNAPLPGYPFIINNETIYPFAPPYTLA